MSQSEAYLEYEVSPSKEISLKNEVALTKQGFFDKAQFLRQSKAFLKSIVSQTKEVFLVKQNSTGKNLA